MRRLARMLHRVHLDQRHVFHDPRSGHSAKQILGPGSAHLFKQMVLRQGRKAVQAKELTPDELLALKQYKKEHKTKVKLSTPAEMTANEILPSVTPLGYSSDSDFDPEDSSDEEMENKFDLGIQRRKIIRQRRKPPPKDWTTDQDDEPRMQSYPGASALPSMDPSRGMKKFYNYNGRWKNGKPHGFGTYVFATSTNSTNGRYEGDSDQGHPHGSGVRHFRNGCVYEGTFKNGMMDGAGSMKNKEGRVFYEGEFKEGQRHGQGRFSTKSGVVYEGAWEDGERNGHGREMNKRGSKYVGIFKDDRIVGPGILDLKKSDMVANHNTQHFIKGNWYDERFPETVTALRDEIISEKLKRRLERRELTKQLDKIALKRFVDEARDLIKEEKQRELEELAAAKRKEMNDKRDALKAKREEMLNSLKAERAGLMDEDSSDDGGDSD